MTILKKRLSRPFRFGKKHVTINYGLIALVITASVTTWFLTEFLVSELDSMDLAIAEWISAARPPVKAQIAPPWVTHGRLRVSSDGHYLEHEDGTPFFWFGGMDWGLFTRLTLSEAGDYLSTRASQGMTVIQANALGLIGAGLAASTSPGVNEEHGRNPYDIQPFTSTFDATSAKVPEYWDHVDNIIDIAASNSLYIALLPAWGTIAIRGWGNNTDPDKIFSNPSDAYDYGQWIGNRFKDKDNIIWVIGGDVPADYRSTHSTHGYSDPYTCDINCCNTHYPENNACTWQCWCSDPDPDNCTGTAIWDNLAQGIIAGDPEWNGIKWRGDNAGSKLKSGDFAALLVGSRDPSGDFNSHGWGADFWTSTASGSNSWVRVPILPQSQLYRYANDRQNGASVRCLKN